MDMSFEERDGLSLVKVFVAVQAIYNEMATSNVRNSAAVGAATPAMIDIDGTMIEVVGVHYTGGKLIFEGVTEMHEIPAGPLGPLMQKEEKSASHRMEDDYDSMTTSDLVELTRDRGIEMTSKRADLIVGLRAYDDLQERMEKS